MYNKPFIHVAMSCHWEGLDIPLMLTAVCTQKQRIWPERRLIVREDRGGGTQRKLSMGTLINCNKLKGLFFLVHHYHVTFINCNFWLLWNSQSFSHKTESLALHLPTNQQTWSNKALNPTASRGTLHNQRVTKRPLQSNGGAAVARKKKPWADPDSVAGCLLWPQPS